MATVSNKVYTQAATFRSSEFAARTKTDQSALKLDVEAIMNALKTGTGMDRRNLEQAERMLSQLNDFLTDVSAFLARSDLTDAQRSTYLKRFLGAAINPDDADSVGHDASGERQTSALSTLIAAAISGDVDALKEMLEHGFDKQAIDELDITVMINTASKEMGDWREKNGVNHTPDTFADEIQKTHGDAAQFFDSLAELSPRDKLKRIRERQERAEAAFGVTT